MSDSEKPDSEVKTYPRPLSPHLQIYRPQLTSVLSVLHRLTGIALLIGLVNIVYWLWALSSGPEPYLALTLCFKSPLMQVFLVGWTFALFYHLGNGIRHLFWDMGKGFELKDTYFSGWLVVIFSVIATAVTWTQFYLV